MGGGGNSNRYDLSKWIIHFIHKRKPEDNPGDLAEIARLEGYCGEVRCPDYYDRDGQGVYLLSEYDENEYKIDGEAESFEVLMKILHDGFIHSGWSFRDYNPTIYGPRSAVCFTEMPLYALAEYVRRRGRSGYVGNVAIAFKRSELFEAGARQVIYGLSGEHKEKDYSAGDIYQGRALDESCGIGLNEQYRYVATSLHSDPNRKSIDWTHEREWRWALPCYDSDWYVPGLPFLLNDYPDWFSEVLVIVETSDQKKDVLEYLKSLHDSEGNNMGFSYDKAKIDRVKVVSLEEINNSGRTVLRIEDISQTEKSTFPRIQVSDETKQRVEQAIKESERIALEELKKFIAENPQYDSNRSLAGFAWVCTSVISEITEAFVVLGKAATFGDGVYQLELDLVYPANDDINLAVLMAEAAAKYLTENLGQYFHVRSRLD